MELERPFLRLPYCFDVDHMAEEVRAFADDCWLPHPSGLPGNSAVPLVSINGEPKDGFDGQMAATECLLTSPYLYQVVSSFNEVVARSRLMRLGVGAQVQEHVDFNYHWYSRVRIHIPIITDPAVRFSCGPEEIHMAEGESWLFDSWRRHKVINGSERDRIHLVIDIAGSADFWKLIRRLQRSSEALSVNLVSYQAEYQGELITERFPSSPVMAPGEMWSIVKELISDCHQNPDNDPAMLVFYQDLLFDLVHDWRRHWSLHGFAPSGLKGYQALLKRTSSALKNNPRALITQSNKIGINPIVNQRLLSAALKPQLTNDFFRDRN